ncbi:MAG: guanylate cyclase [Alphaproteobacteria bacterium]|jgi:hypothetical protein|nr:guanylate cyclase [Alphaproteobacteria bacterium]
MKGIVFTVFNNMIEEKFGLKTWQALLDKVQPEGGGAYTAGGTYSDAELFALVTELSRQTKIDVPTLIETFGIYMFPVLAQKYSLFVQPNMDLKDFLKSIDSVIHLEVKKLEENAELPTISYIDPAPHQLIMLYRSPRKLCHLAIGLTKGAANHFKKQISIGHPLCMHKGEEHCRLEITFE